MMLTKRPVARSALRTEVTEVKTVAGGTSSPMARKASATTEPYRLSRGGKSPDCVRQFGKF
jgi:hypothetical protein